MSEHTLVLSDEEVLFLHNIIVHKTYDNDMPACTWDDNCFSCNLYDKFYEAYVQVGEK